MFSQSQLLRQAAAFFAGNKYFQRRYEHVVSHNRSSIHYKSCTRLIPSSSKDTFLLLSRLSREEDPRRRAWSRLLKENISKEFTKKAQLNFTTVQSWTIRSCIRTFDFCPGFRLLEFLLLLVSQILCSGRSHH